MKAAIGLDLGGTSIKYALVDEEGQIMHQGIRPSSATVSAEAVVDQLCKCIEDIERFLSSKAGIDLKGIGIGTPGIIDETTGLSWVEPKIYRDGKISLLPGSSKRKQSFIR